MEERIMNVKEMAEYLNCSVSTIRNLVRKKELPYFRDGYNIRFKLTQVIRSLERNDKRKKF